METYDSTDKRTRPCAGGCGLQVRMAHVAYGKKTYVVLIHTGFAPDQYRIVERCRAQ